MEYTSLGRSGLRVSIVSLGGGGHSRLGTATGNSEQESIAVVRQALDLGINLIDTAEAYGTEAISARRSGTSGAIRSSLRPKNCCRLTTIPSPGIRKVECP